ncbi:MAG TPA: hypothetical protein PLV93_08645 [Microthrixaceae bacterium]|nr:hypothetical protein [Microthrixaceae bacterium]
MGHSPRRYSPYCEGCGALLEGHRIVRYRYVRNGREPAVFVWFHEVCAPSPVSGWYEPAPGGSDE